MKGPYALLKEMNSYIDQFNTWYNHITVLSNEFWSIVDLMNWQNADLTVLTFDDIVGINHLQMKAMNILEYLVDYDRWWRDNNIEERFVRKTSERERHNRLLELGYSMYNKIEEVVKGGNNKLVVEEYPLDFVPIEELDEFMNLIDKERYVFEGDPDERLAIIKEIQVRSKKND